MPFPLSITEPRVESVPLVDISIGPTETFVAVPAALRNCNVMVVEPVDAGIAELAGVISLTIRSATT